MVDATPLHLQGRDYAALQTTTCLPGRDYAALQTTTRGNSGFRCMKMS